MCQRLPRDLGGASGLLKSAVITQFFEGHGVTWINSFEPFKCIVLLTDLTKYNVCAYVIMCGRFVCCEWRDE